MYTLTSVCIFSKLFSILFIRCWQGEFVHQSKANVSMVIISFVLMTLMCDSQVILKGEIRCWSLLRFKGLRTVQWGTLSIADVDPKLWIFFLDLMCAVKHLLVYVLCPFLFLFLIFLKNVQTSFILIFFIFDFDHYLKDISTTNNEFLF